MTRDERAIVGSGRGLRWWGAIALALGLAAVGAAIDMQVQDKLGLLFKGCYFVGCVGAACAVRRGSLFTPMVQPPLVLAVTVPGVVLFGSGLPDDSDTLARILAVGNPLINGFPTMAVTTAVTLAIGIFRVIRERDPEAAGKRAAGHSAKAPGAKAVQAKRATKPAEPKDPGRLTADGPPASGRRARRSETPVPPPPAADPSAGGTRAGVERRRARPLEPREPGTSTALPGTRRPARDAPPVPKPEPGAGVPKRDAGPASSPGRRRRADDPSIPRRTSGEVPRRPLREGTPRPSPRRLRPEPGAQPPRRGPAPKPPAGKRPWEIEDD